jgi:membrane protein implicated in regulation of membrane protease activity
MFFALFGAVGSFVAAGVALGSPHAIGLQVVVAIVVSVIGVVGVRPLVSRISDRGGHGLHVARGVHGGIIGQQVLTLDEVGDTHHVGHAMLAGERWLATSGSGQPIPPHSNAVITAVSGTTLTIWPIDVDGLTEGNPS